MSDFNIKSIDISKVVQQTFKSQLREFSQMIQDFPHYLTLMMWIWTISQLVYANLGLYFGILFSSRGICFLII